MYNRADEYLNDLKSTGEYIYQSLMYNNPSYLGFMQSLPNSITIDKGLRDVAFWKRPDDEHFVTSSTHNNIYSGSGKWLGVSTMGGRMIYFGNDRFRFMLIGWK